MEASREGLAQAIITVLSTAGYAGLARLMAAESACIPLPSEVILPFAGFLVSQGTMNLFLVATTGVVGCNLGSAVAYALGGMEGGGRSSAGANTRCCAGRTWSGPTGSSSASAAWPC
jgi:membrane protein DedA with SNARE-associated domain